MPRFKATDLFILLAVGLLMWVFLDRSRWQQLVVRPATQLSFPQFDPPSRHDWTPHAEVEVGWLAELGERFVWSGMRLAERFSQEAVSVASGLRSPWSWTTQPAGELHFVRTVVVDPGHGGRDPGATGVGGLSEKWVTLRLSRALRSELENRGFRVITTRYGDQTVSLRRRIEIAEQEGGDLFVSLHVNASTEHDVHGLMTYYPDKNYARHARRVADGAGGTPAAQLHLAGRTLIDSDSSKMFDLSAELAGAVHQRTVSGVRDSYRSLSDRGVRSGPFFVLFLSSMPSVLMEVGFLTHQQEAGRMRSDAYVSLLAAAIAEGIAGYRDAGDWDTRTTLQFPAALETDNPT